MLCARTVVISVALVLGLLAHAAQMPQFVTEKLSLLPSLSHSALKPSRSPTNGSVLDTPMAFRLIDYLLETEISCQSKPLRPEFPVDFDVRCGDRSFLVHLVLAQHQRERGSLSELLYWITESGKQEVGQSSWLNADKGRIERWQIRQFIDQGHRALELELGK